jgi:hypothetical protein
MKTDTGMINAFVEGATGLDPATSGLIAQRKKLLGPAYRLFYERPVHFVRGEGAWLFDPEGNAFLDAYNNVTSIGHCHPKVVEAVSRQMALLTTNTRYLHDDVLHYGMAVDYQLIETVQWVGEVFAERETASRIGACYDQVRPSVAIRIEYRHTRVRDPEGRCPLNPLAKIKLSTAKVTPIMIALTGIQNVR